jgi:hypothetical protein
VNIQGNPLLGRKMYLSKAWGCDFAMDPPFLAFGGEYIAAINVQYLVSLDKLAEAITITHHLLSKSF